MSHPLSEDSLGTPPVQHLRQVWDITQDPAADFATKVDRIFELETDHLDLPYGFVSRTDVAAGTQTIEASRGSHELLQPDQTCPLSESYCRRTIQQSDGVFRIHDARAEGYETDPAYRRFGLESYLGSTIEFGGSTHGTFCFASSDPRGEPFSEGERALVEMLSRWASNELSERQTRERLQCDSERVEELTGLVSHDLRNPLAIARGQAHLLETSVEESVAKIDRAHDRMERLIDDVLTFARIDEPVENPPAIELKSCTVDAWEVVQTHEATLTVAFESAAIYADEERLKRLFENLFRNAVEHGSAGTRTESGDAAERCSASSQRSADDAPERGDGSVSVEVGTTETGFYVADDGLGIPASERDAVFDAGYSRTADNTGFGLSIVRRIADSHGWNVAITDSATGGARFEITGVEFVR